MARKPNPLKGLSVSDLLDVPLEAIDSLNRSEISQIVSRMAAVANKRLKRLEQSGFKRGSDSGPNVISGTRKFVAKGKTLNQLRNEFSRVRKFLEGKTSTVTGMRKTREEFYQRLADNTGKDVRDVRAYFAESDYSDSELTPGQKFWRVVKNAERFNLFAQSGYSSSQIQGVVYNLMTDYSDKSVVELLNMLGDMGIQAYEQLESVEDDYNESDFVTL